MTTPRGDRSGALPPEQSRAAGSVRHPPARDRLDDVIVNETIGPSDAAFISSLDHFFLATVNPDGMPTVGYKGGAAGFVRVLDDRTLAFPNYNGNGMYLSMGNVLDNGNVGMLFINWEKGHRLRVQGTASIDYDDELMPDYPEAQFIVRVTTTAVFPQLPPLHPSHAAERGIPLRAT